jgi:hypothetical protein
MFDFVDMFSRVSQKSTIFGPEWVVGVRELDDNPAFTGILAGDDIVCVTVEADTGWLIWIKGTDAEVVIYLVVVEELLVVTSLQFVVSLGSHLRQN